jgi:hypothetical protein
LTIGTAYVVTFDGQAPKFTSLRAIQKSSNLVDGFVV